MWTMALPDVKGLFFYLFDRFWWVFFILVAIFSIYIAKELVFYLYFNFYLRSEEGKKSQKRRERESFENMRELQSAQILGKISPAEFEIPPVEDSLSIVDKQKSIRAKVGSIVATEDIHNLLASLEKKREKPEPLPPPQQPPPQESKEEEKKEEKPEEVRRLTMRKARLILTIKKLDEDFSAGKVSDESHRKQRAEFISELADTEESLIEYEMKRKAQKR